MLILGFLGMLLSFLLLEGSLRQNRQAKLNNAVLDDQILAYHLDWKAVQDQNFLLYLYVKKVNAIVRYQALAAVSYEEARQAIEYLLANPELLPAIPQKRRPALPNAEDAALALAIAEGRLDEAAKRYQLLLDVDPFTARLVVERMLEDIEDEHPARLMNN